MATILVVDDAPEFRALARLLAESRGMNVLQAADGPIALTILLRAQPDVMLLDVHMPAMNGLDVLATLRCNANLMRPKKVIVVSADGEDSLQHEALELGADGFLDKSRFCAAFLEETVASIERASSDSAIPTSGGVSSDQWRRANAA